MSLTPAQLIVKAEFFLQGAVKYGLPAACPHCRSSKATLVARKARVIRLVRCTSCGLTYTRPVYRSWLTDNFYDRLYQAEGSTTALPDDATLQRLLATQFRGTDKDAGDRLGGIRAAAHGEQPTLLEIGSSWGYFLAQARERGFQVTGLEIGDSRREFGVRKLGLKIVSTWADLAPEQRFDVIYTSHVLEHFTDLSQVFSHLARHLADDGTLFLEVPNIDVEQLGPRVLGMVGAVHPLGFDSAFFRRNLPKYGLEVTGFFNSWAEVSSAPRERSEQDMLILRARKLPAARS